jgi:hypothetical protein
VDRFERPPDVHPSCRRLPGGEEVFFDPDPAINIAVNAASPVALRVCTRFLQTFIGRSGRAGI